MAIHSKILVVYEDPATLKELLAAANGLEFLPLRDRRQAVACVKAYPSLAAVIVEQVAEAKGFLETLQNVQAAQPTLRRVAVSDSSDLFSVIDGLHTGAIDAVLYRPVDARQLHAAVRGSEAGAAPVTTQGAPARRNATAR
ncbi:hypothetical protein BH09PLA1_BH09PLA1_29520 [soil metagenome]